MNLVAVIAGEWTLLFVALLLVAARVFVRLILNKTRLNASDYLLFIGAGAGIGLISCDTIIYSEGTWLNYEDPGERTLMARYLIGWFFDSGIYFPKFSIIAFYYTLVPNTQPRMRIALYALTALTVACWIATIFINALWCGTNVSVNWKVEPIEPGACSVFDSDIAFQIQWGLHFTTEMLNVLFPFPIVRNLKLARLRDKIGLCVIFGLGLITIAVSIGRFSNLMSGQVNYAASMWGTSELSVSIAIVALTALRPLLRKLAYLVNGSYGDSDYKNYAYGGAASNSKRTKPTLNQGSGVYWRTYGASRNQDNEPDADAELGSEVELNNLPPHAIMKREEIHVSTEVISPHVSPPERATHSPSFESR